MSEKQKMPLIDLPGVTSRIEALREVHGLSKEAFSLSFGLDPSSYSKLLNHTKPLKSEHGFALAERWGVTMDFIYRGDLSRLPDDTRAKLIATLKR